MNPKDFQIACPCNFYKVILGARQNLLMGISPDRVPDSRHLPSTTTTYHLWYKQFHLLSLSFLIIRTNQLVAFTIISMGAGASSQFEIPARVTYVECWKLANECNLKFKQNIFIDKGRFDVMKRESDETISRVEALQFSDNKFTPLLSVNGLVNIPTVPTVSTSPNSPLSGRLQRK